MRIQAVKVAQNDADNPHVRELLEQKAGGAVLNQAFMKQ